MRSQSSDAGPGSSPSPLLFDPSTRVMRRERACPRRPDPPRSVCRRPLALAMALALALALAMALAAAMAAAMAMAMAMALA